MAFNLILPCKLSQNLPTNDSLKKVQLKQQVVENCILLGFFEILLPRRHSLGQRELKCAGILSFSPSLYNYSDLLQCPSFNYSLAGGDRVAAWLSPTKFHAVD